MLADCDGQIDSTQSSKFVLSSTCPVDHVTSHKLNTPCGKAQYALVKIPTKLCDALVVGKVQRLTQEEASQAKDSLWKTFLVTPTRRPFH